MEVEIALAALAAPSPAAQTAPRCRPLTLLGETSSRDSGFRAAYVCGMADDSESGSPRQRAGGEQSSDQAPGEEMVQVNDPYRGGGEPPDQEPAADDEQHQTGG